MGGHRKVVFVFYIKWYENSCSSFILFKCATASYPSNKRLKYSNCTITTSKYLEENQEINFHYHRQAHLIHYFIRNRCHYYCMWFNVERSQIRIFYKSGQTTWSGQNVIRLTWMIRPGFNPGAQASQVNSVSMPVKTAATGIFCFFACLCMCPCP